MQFKTERKVGKTGVMLVGLGGNNGCTCVAGAIDNRVGMTWDTKEGEQSSNYWGNVMLASTVKLGNDPGVSFGACVAGTFRPRTVNFAGTFFR